MTTTLPTTVEYSNGTPTMRQWERSLVTTTKYYGANGVVKMEIFDHVYSGYKSTLYDDNGEVIRWLWTSKECGYNGQRGFESGGVEGCGYKTDYFNEEGGLVKSVWVRD